MEEYGFRSNLLQNCLQFAIKRQGTTSVVPKTAFCDSGFSRCGIANNRKQRYAAAKAQDLFAELAARLKSCPDASRNLHGILQEARSNEYYAECLITRSPTLAAPLSWRQEWDTRKSTLQKQLRCNKRLNSNGLKYPRQKNLSWARKFFLLAH